VLETLGLQEAVLDVVGHEAVELVHRNGVTVQPTSPWRALVEQV